jgi:hypothetical protein
MLVVIEARTWCPLLWRWTVAARRPTPNSSSATIPSLEHTIVRAILICPERVLEFWGNAGCRRGTMMRRSSAKLDR